eukprot:gnl/Hemi2/21657_TR7217_c0_g2_i1.p1 gnl/Hemi2/21657_TR7217_c0_g2~~gnl/Hemi2/21657_TR7217_c0_g2_i1.p1  ORF type:complete len:291 (-),score=31.81 gnl/Hemi2/21657_TR7217_c0_g2_i1:19-891(-)
MAWQVARTLFHSGMKNKTSCYNLRTKWTHPYASTIDSPSSRSLCGSTVFVPPGDVFDPEHSLDFADFPYGISLTTIPLQADYVWTLPCGASIPTGADWLTLWQHGSAESVFRLGAKNHCVHGGQQGMRPKVNQHSTPTTLTEALGIFGLSTHEGGSWTRYSGPTVQRPTINGADVRGASPQACVYRAIASLQKTLEVTKDEVERADLFTDIHVLFEILPSLNNRSRPSWLKPWETPRVQQAIKDSLSLFSAHKVRLSALLRNDEDNEGIACELSNLEMDLHFMSLHLVVA